MKPEQAFIFYDSSSGLLPIYAGGRRGAAAAAIVAIGGISSLIESAEYLMSKSLKSGRESEWEIAIKRLVDLSLLTSKASEKLSTFQA